MPNKPNTIKKGSTKPRKKKDTTKEETTARRKKELLEALEQSLGIPATACKKVGIGRTTFYQWRKDDPDFNSAYLEIKEDAKDWGESKLYELMQGVTVEKTIAGEEVIYTRPPDTAAVLFFAKTQLKDRGYTEKQEIDFTQMPKLEVQVIGSDGKEIDI